ncbi:putative exonuclease [Mycobacterium phage Y10]|uniref:Putative exonuclease n=1 Tax=Mycobacterium phage Y10 TaxID=2072010 RepID=A0A2Z5XB04_9CAUD|nr:DnaQ-like DNA polymerase III subunit [Mycobacterium phage JF1]BBC43348.1 putative exonuclease [Mycobacterium phage Y10]BBC43439.1 putative exonuclease [Mycobacterium phage Y2]BBC43530.1 putative exonuclease [Mycobacterium phage Y10]
MSRQLIVVDCETTGLHDDAAILEIAAVNVETGDELAFVPYVSGEQLAKAQPDALRINRYYERGVYREMLSPADTADAFDELATMLKGNTFGGSNPTFDSHLVASARVTPPSYAVLGAEHVVGRVWHHRLADLAAYAAGVLGLNPTELPGLDAVIDKVDFMVPIGEVDNYERHTALGDARITASCFRRLTLWAEQNRSR